MKRDSIDVGWVKNPDPMNKPDFSNRDEQPVDIPWCESCGQPMSLCRCSD